MKFLIELLKHIHTLLVFAPILISNDFVENELMGRSNQIKRVLEGSEDKGIIPVSSYQELQNYSALQIGQCCSLFWLWFYLLKYIQTPMFTKLQCNCWLLVVS